MKITKIAKRQIKIVLSPEDAQRLALACRAAGRISGGDYGVSPESIFGSNYLPVAERLYEGLAAAFESAGMACAAYSYISEHMSPVTGKPMAAFTLKNVRAQKIGDRLW